MAEMSPRCLGADKDRWLNASDGVMTMPRVIPKIPERIRP